MNFAHIHIAVVHLPVVAVPLLLLMLLSAEYWRKTEVRVAALIGLVIVGLVTIPIYLTGEEAEEVVEHLAGVYKNRIEGHEALGTASFIGVLLTGAASLITLLAHRRRTNSPQIFLRLTLLLALVTSGLLAWTANAGGMIRHLPEITGEVTSPQSDSTRLE